MIKWRDIYPVPMELEQQEIVLGLFRPVVPPTDAQRMRAAKLVEGWEVMQWTGYWMMLQEIVASDRQKAQKSTIGRLKQREWDKCRRQVKRASRRGKKSSCWRCSINEIRTKKTK